ncbi:hypothetical protein [uncultured Massilia sp.]|uniref:hypothetical protein n=1 Tax=uncultured Massilia sp. TaxID=169973 RepID=UPI002586B45C|nr:hypothetical protein [uncultured Massilia sp.]
MRKKLVGAAVAIGLIAAMVAFQQRQAAPPPGRSAAPVQAVAAAPEETQHDADPARAPSAGEVTQSLKGADFTLRVTVNGNDRYRDLEITMDDGKPVRFFRAPGSEPGDLSNIIFDQADTFALARLLPDEAREQIVVAGSQWLMRGEGLLGRYTVYRIAGEELQEIFSVITERDREEGNGPPPQKLAARVEPATRDGAPAFAYHVKAGDAAERTIVFVWNGERFDDPGGDYANIEEEYAP